LYDSSPSPLLIQRKRTAKTTRLGLYTFIHKTVNSGQHRALRQSKHTPLFGGLFFAFKGGKNNLIKPPFFRT